MGLNLASFLFYFFWIFLDFQCRQFDHDYIHENILVIVESGKFRCVCVCVCKSMFVEKSTRLSLPHTWHGIGTFFFFFLVPLAQPIDNQLLLRLAAVSARARAY